MAIAARFGRIAPDEIEAARTLDEKRPEESVGDIERFFVHDIVNQRYLEVDAELELMTDVAAVWVQRGQPFDADALEAGARRFSEHVYPELRAAFGSEWSPGVDLDHRIHILHHEPVPGIAGFFSSSDEMSPQVDPQSNAREMFYINLSVFRPGTDDYLALLAHEFQHMIHWNYDRGEPTWVNEGLSEIAPHLVGYGAQRGESYLSQPDIQLTGWKPTAQTNSAHYAAAYLFIAYLQDRFGDEVLRAIVQSPRNGAAGIEAAVASVMSSGAADVSETSSDVSTSGSGISPEGSTDQGPVSEVKPGTDVGTPSFDELFMDWAIANAIGDSRGDSGPDSIRDAGGETRADNPASDGRWTYRRPLPRVVRPDPMNVRGVRDTVNQYGVDYWDVTEHVRDGRLDLDFRGAATVGLLDPLDPERAVGAAGGYPGADGGYPDPDEESGFIDGSDVTSADGAATAGPSGGYPSPGDRLSGDYGTTASAAYPNPDLGDGDDSEAVDGAAGDAGSTHGSSVDSTAGNGSVAAGSTTSGEVWWSGQGDGMHSLLEHQVDLSNAAEGWLDLSIWYELEENWDYAYYTASVDGGLTWRTIGSRLTTDVNPNGSNLGEGLTGDSRGWVVDRVDLTPFAGEVVFVAIEVITDDAVSLAGVAVDDLQFVVDGVEIDSDQDQELAASDWSPSGWLLIDPRLPQVWGLQLVIDQGRGQALRVERFAAGPDGRVEISASDIPPDATLTFVVSGLTPATRNVAGYEVRVMEAAESSSEPSP